MRRAHDNVSAAVLVDVAHGCDGIAEEVAGQVAEAMAEPGPIAPRVEPHLSPAAAEGAIGDREVGVEDLRGAVDRLQERQHAGERKAGA